MYGDTQHWYWLLEFYSRLLLVTKSLTASQCLCKVASHCIELKLDLTSYQSISVSFFTNCALKSRVLFKITVSVNFECAVKYTVIYFQIPSPPIPLKYDRFFWSGRKKKERVCEPRALDGSLRAEGGTLYI